MKWSYLVSRRVVGRCATPPPSSTSSSFLLHNYSFATVGIYCASPVNYKLIWSLVLVIPFGMDFGLLCSTDSRVLGWWMGGDRTKNGDKELTPVCRRNVTGDAGMRRAYLSHRLYYSLNYSITTTNEGTTTSIASTSNHHPPHPPPPATAARTFFFISCHPGTYFPVPFYNYPLCKSSSSSGIP